MICRSWAGSTRILLHPAPCCFPRWPPISISKNGNGFRFRMPPKSSFLEKVLGRINRLDNEGLQTVVQRLMRERSFLETLFNTIEDGVLVVDEEGRIVYFNQAVTRLLGLHADGEGQPVTNFIPELDWQKISRIDHTGGQGVVRHEFEVQYPRPRF